MVLALSRRPHMPDLADRGVPRSWETGPRKAMEEQTIDDSAEHKTGEIAPEHQGERTQIMRRQDIDTAKDRKGRDDGGVDDDDGGTLDVPLSMSEEAMVQQEAKGDADTTEDGVSMAFQPRH